MEGSERNSEGIVEKYSHSGERPEWSRIEFSLPFTPLILLHNAILEGAARDIPVTRVSDVVKWGRLYLIL